MERRNIGSRPTKRSVFGALAWFAGALAWAAVAAIGAMMAVILAAVVVAAALMASVILALSGAVFRARRAARVDDDVLEARHVGGHSWVAYAGNARR
ncbi:MAG: hypothetical protein ABI306_09790 [Caulobacteraceae bacterium]